MMLPIPCPKSAGGNTSAPHVNLSPGVLCLTKTRACHNSLPSRCKIPVSPWSHFRGQGSGGLNLGVALGLCPAVGNRTYPPACFVQKLIAKQAG